MAATQFAAEQKRNAKRVDDHRCKCCQYSACDAGAGAARNVASELLGEGDLVDAAVFGGAVIGLGSWPAR